MNRRSRFRVGAAGFAVMTFAATAIVSSLTPAYATCAQTGQYFGKAMTGANNTGSQPPASGDWQRFVNLPRISASCGLSFPPSSLDTVQMQFSPTVGQGDFEAGIRVYRDSSNHPVYRIFYEYGVFPNQPVPVELNSPCTIVNLGTSDVAITSDFPNPYWTAQINCDNGQGWWAFTPPSGIYTPGYSYGYPLGETESFGNATMATDHNNMALFNPYPSNAWQFWSHNWMHCQINSPGTGWQFFADYQAKGYWYKIMSGTYNGAYCP
jgi:hypothetical protein